MNQAISIKKQTILFFILLFCLLSGANAQEAVPFTPRLEGGNIEIRGDIIFVGNNILNRASQANPAEANTPYNGNANNNSLWMEYIDIDNDPTTFSSSSAELNIADPACSQVRYAGLYWAATYPNERSTNAGAQFTGTPRIEDWNQIKFKLPSGNYIDLSADTAPDLVGEEDDIIFDGYDPININNSFKDSPYICYKNVTDLVRSNTNPNGEYTVANIRATKGRRNGSSSAGWVLVIIYENPTETGKFISTFDGYAGLSGAVGNVDVAVNGFRTLPNPFPVRARIGVGALEGDRGITNDRFFIRANSNAGFTNLATGLNPNNNFFNSTITTNGAEVPTRNPFGTNTLGTDLDLFNLDNPGRTILPNNESGATLRFTSSGDGYGAFLASFSVEIIEPSIILEKRVEDIAGNDITGLGVNLGQTIDYVLSFRNLGNDHGTGRDASSTDPFERFYTIRDVLPVNVTLDESNITLPTGVIYRYNATINEIEFAIPDEHILINGPITSLRMRVRVAENCFDFVDACTNLIENIAFSTYAGVLNSAVISDDPSVSDFDNCGFVTPGATNFLLDDLSDCNFSRTVELCGADVLLDAGNGFDDYIWYRDINNNNLIDIGTDIVITDGNSDNDLSTLLVTQAGTYIVDKIVADPCKGFTEIMTVTLFGTTQTNPILDFFNDRNSDADPNNDIQGEILRCSIDGETTANIFLCGANDSELLQVNITAQSIEWQQLNETTCSTTDPSCPIKGDSCYNTIRTGNAFNVTDTGKYRLVVNYANGCSSRFYFSAFKNNLAVNTIKTDIFCNTNGNITVTNLGAGYGFQLFDTATNTVVVPFSANNGPSFDITRNGSYRIDVRQLDTAGNPIPNSCEFQSEEIGVLDRDFQVNLRTTPANCNALGSINVQVLNVRENYIYDLRFNDGISHSYGIGTRVNLTTPQTTNNFTFNNLNPDDYTVIVTTQDGCTETQNITVSEVDEVQLSAVTLANIGCSPGTIVLTASGGFVNPNYSYAIWSKDGTALYTDITAIPGDAFQSNPIFEFGYTLSGGPTDENPTAPFVFTKVPGEEGVYTFVAIDANGCFRISNEVTLLDVGNMTISVTDDTPIVCNSSNNASITINTVNGVAPFEYSIDNGVTFQDTPSFVGLAAGTYQIVVTDDSGCRVTLEHIIANPLPLSASAGVARDVTCDALGAQVRITNVVGGVAPYTYSFDGGATFGPNSTAILPPGNYNTVVVRDALGCEFPMNVFVEDYPVDPSVTPVVDYNCDGTGNITVGTDITTYNYTYALNGTLNTPDATSNIFSNLAPGTYNVTTNYTSQTPPTPSLLLVEDFGYGGTIENPNTLGYRYEDQTVNPPGDNNRNINDFEYAVTNRIVAPFGSWLNPGDHTTNGANPDGRYLVINVGTPSPGQIIYSKAINDVIPNQDLRISLYIFNLVNRTSTILDPDLTIEIRTTTGTVVQSIRTGDIPKTEQWENFSVDLNPGNNTALEFVIRSEKVGNNGNDFALDDIEIYQIPEVCDLSTVSTVIIEDDRAFEANFLSSTNVTCFGGTNGTITFEVENFDPITGFEYSIDGGAFVTSLTSPVTTAAVLGAGVRTIDIRRVDDISCSQQITRTITQPTAVVATANIRTAFTCANTGAIIRATATGGTPGYEYQLEDTTGNVINAYQMSRDFTNVPAGTYLVRIKDIRDCDDLIDAPITITAPTALTFTATPSTCYSGANDGTIAVNVTGGNGGLLFSINNGPFLAPSPTTANTYTFTNLGSGDYIINVQDQLGCTVAAQTIRINPTLSVSASASAITTCATSTNITITATGGDTNYVYAIVADGVTPLDTDFTTTNILPATATGAYDVYVRDNGGAAGFCTDMFDINITQNPPIAITETVTNVTCFGGNNGAISLAITGGNGPYRYSNNGGTSYQTSNNFPNLTAGTYAVLVQDADLCTQPLSVTVNEPLAITAEAIQTTDYTCLPSGEAAISVGSVTPTAGGSGNYQYSINGGTWTASTTGGTVFTGLTDGTYSVRVRDANATTCFITLPNVIIDPLPVAPTLTSAIAYNCDGTGNITVSPFDAAYSYAIDGGIPQTGATANIFNNIVAGNHVITVNYGNGCTTAITINVANGRAFNATLTAPANVSCFGGTDGGFTLNATNFSASGFEYSINGAAFVGPFTTSQTVTGLTAQAYTVEVRDVNSPTVCTVSLTQTLTAPIAITATASITTAFTCDNTGATIRAIASGGTPIYTYRLEINTAPGTAISTNNTGIFTNVAANAVGENYVVVVTDSRSCTSAVSPTVTVNAPEVPTFTVTPTACYSGANDGTIQVDVTSVPGNGNFQFRINGGAWLNPNTSATRHIFSGLANGSYTIDVQDGFGCDAVQETVVLSPQLVVSVDAINVSSCNDGSITVNATGGNGTLVYAIVPANSDPTGLFTTTNSLVITNAMATANPLGYDVHVRDNNGVSHLCSFLQEDIIINTATPLTVTGIATSPECFDGLGSIDATVTGGNGPFNYTLVDLSPADGINYGVSYTNIATTSYSFAGIGVGNYRIDVTDADLCLVSSTIVTITNAIEITADIGALLPATCNDPDPLQYGFEFLNITAPSGTVEYSADGGTTWQTSNELRGYASGTTVNPSIRVTLASGTICQRDFPRYIIPFPLDDLDIDLNAIVVDCNDLQVRVQGTAGVAPYEYAFSENPSSFNPAAATWIAGGTERIIAGVSTTVSPGFGNYTWTGLTPGRTYVFYVRDASGCVRQSLQNVNDLIAEPLAITTDVTPSCFGLANGEITFTLNPTTVNTQMRWEVYRLGNATPIAVSGGGATAINVAYNNTITVTGLNEAEYYIEVVQTDGTTDTCTGGSENALVDELNAITATATATRDISCNLPGLISISGITGGGGSPYTFDVTGPAGFTALTGLTSNPIQIPVNSPAGDYIVTLNDQYGCPVTLPFVTLGLTSNPTIDSLTQDNCTSPISLTVNATGAGVIRYAIVSNGSAAPTTYLNNGGVFNNITPGSYDVYIIDGNGCTAMQAAYVVNPILSARAELTKVLDCTVLPDATITIEALTGSGSYEYSISGAATVARTALTGSFVYNAATAGDYIITIYDTATADTATCNRTFTINVPAAIQPIFTETHTAITCNGADDGTITLNQTNNGINPLTYELRFDTTGFPLVPAGDFTFDGTTQTYSDLAPGNFVVRGIGANDCFTDVDITITEPVVIAVTIDPLADVAQFACTPNSNTDNNATITVNPANISGGSGTYVRYVFENTATSTIVQDGPSNEYIETNRIGGTYSITVYDDNNCIGTTTATINAFDELLTINAAISSAITCTPGNDGEVTIAVTSTVNDATRFEFSNNNRTSWQPSNVFAGLSEGTHNFIVRHLDTGCELFTSINITNPNTFTVATPVTTDVVCFGTATGTATFTVADATYIGTYSWDIFDDNDTPTNYTDDTLIQTGNDTNLSATGLLAGGYYVTFTQDGVPTCDNRRAFSISEPTATLAAGTPIVAPITCAPGNADGSIEITNVTGGWGGYGYYVSQTANPDPTDTSNYIANPRFENLGAGTYEIWVIDSNGCPLQLADITLTIPSPITADLQLNNENCANFEGELQVINQAGGQGSNYSYQLQRWDGTAYVNLRAIQTTDVFSNLGAGQYQVIVSDQWDCNATTSNAITMYDELVPLASVIKTIDCISGGEITISQTGGSGTYAYTGTFPDGSALTPNTDGIFTGLSQVGEYIFTITDGTCSEIIRQRLEAAVQPLTPTIDAFTNVTCFNAADGTISVSINTNGFDPYTFEITAMDGTAVSMNPTSSTPVSAEFTGLANTIGAGYTITVTASNGCFTTVSQTISQPAAAVAIATPVITEFDCTTGNATNFATIDVTGLVTGGSLNYVRYVFTNDANPTVPVQDGSNSLYTETNVLGGNYTITVYDDMGCSATTTAIIAPFVGISAPTVAIVDTVTCNGNDEEITVGVTVSPSSATPNLSYEVVSTNGYSQTITSTNASENFTGLGIGNYVITITNTDTGCFVRTTHVVTDPKVIEVTAVKVTDEACLNDGINGGSFNVTITNYTGGYSYQVFRANGTPFSAVLTGNTATPLVIDNLLGGSYYVQITETDATSTFCSDNSNAVTILTPEFPISAIISEQANVTCDNNRGSILVDPSGGRGPYTITIASGSQTITRANVEAFIFTGLSAGNFTVTITDALGCSFTDNITLVQPDPIVATISADMVLDCYGDDTGVVTATITSGGIGTLQYRLNSYDITGTVIISTSVAQNSNTFTGLFSGRYSITVSDEVRCIAETPIANITDPVDVFGSLTLTQSITCVDDLELVLTANGGTGPYSYSVDGVTFVAFNNGNQHNFNNLPSGNAGAGTYQYYVQDSFNCTSILSNEIRADAVAPITITIDTSAATVNCSGDNSAILIARASGGLGNYQYELLDNPTSTTPLQGPNTNGVFRDLIAGNYYIKVISEDCEEVTTVIPITEPDPLIYTDDYSATICAGDTNGFINVSLSGGSGDYKYAISPNLAQFDVVNQFTDLAPGTYTVIAQDAKGCFVQTDYIIAASPEIIINATPTGETCLGSNDGSLNLVLSGGIAPYRTRLESTNYVSGLLQYNDLASGQHTVFVIDSLGCETSIQVTVAAGVNIKATVTPVYECTDTTPENSLTVVLEDPSVAGSALYQLDDENSADVRLEPSFTNIPSGDHTLIISLNGCLEVIPFTIQAFDPLVLSLENSNINEITANANGGDGNYTFYFDNVSNGDDNTIFINRSGTYTVRVVDGNGCETSATIEMEFIDIEIPNFFTPDGDNNNDVWKPRNIEGFPNILTLIFDRYGRELYRMGQNDKGWEGIYQESDLPTGDYWYVIKLKGENDDREFVGHFTLYR
ncbi:MAG: T9SS type B sorting domain-containing protein [Cellulophaga sp.]|nr:T9SS type B sorting domain-containing protein [Cellulophaga sp.]